MSKLGYLPEDSTVVENLDGTITITPPTGWDYIGVKTNGDVEQISGGQITISCT